MNVALVHNFYQQSGGEDQVFAAECALLESKGHAVSRFTVQNRDIGDMSRLTLARKTIWNNEQYRELRSHFRKSRPAVVHVHNTLPLISPAVYFAARSEGAAVVQTLHNFRLSCVNGLFFRDGHPCEDCMGKVVAWPGILHACYRNSHAASGVVAAMLGYHKLRGTYSQQVDQYIALTEFSRKKFIEIGLPTTKVVVKPNFVAPDPGTGRGQGGYALFVGRLSEEKGLSTLLAGWKTVGGRLPLKIVGDGPLAETVQATGKEANVKWMGRQPRESVLALMKEAHLLVFPSVWYEGFPMTIAEALATGTPIVASGMGNMASLVEHGRTGLHFKPGDSSDLAAQVMWALEHPEAVAQMRVQARAEFERSYTSEVNYLMLMEIYERARSLTNGEA